MEDVTFCKVIFFLRMLRLRLGASVAFYPVFFCLHLSESRHCPLEGKSFLLSAEDGQAAGFFLVKCTDK